MGMGSSACAAGERTIRFFVEPVVLTINYAIGVLGYSSVLMMGKSGGGWTTTLAAALDPRIGASFAVAGSLPLRFQPRQWDFEQRDEPKMAAQP